MARLFMACLRTKFQPDTIPADGNVSGGHYQSSRPLALPVSTSSCRFFRVISASRVSNRYRGGLTGRIRRFPSFTVRSTLPPSSTCASLAKLLGILRPRLLPHFWIFVITVSLLYTQRVYIGSAGKVKAQVLRFSVIPRIVEPKH